MTSHSNLTPTVIPTGPTTVTSTIEVAGAGSRLVSDLDLFLNIQHAWAADLDIALMSPGGDGGHHHDRQRKPARARSPARRSTTQADPDGQVPYVTNLGIVTDHLYENAVATPLVSEEALAAFRGREPGTASGRSRSPTPPGSRRRRRGGELAARHPEHPSAVPVETTTQAQNATALAIGPAQSVTTSTIDVTGAGAHLSDLNLFTDITHTWSADLDITLRSPAGTVATITTDNASGNDNALAGTLFDDQRNPAGLVPYLNNPGLTTDHPYANNELLLCWRPRRHWRPSTDRTRTAHGRPRSATTTPVTEATFGAGG